MNHYFTNFKTFLIKNFPLNMASVRIEKVSFKTICDRI